MHGGPSTGAKTPEGIERIRKARTKHGRYSAASIARRREARRIMSEIRALLNVDPAQASDDDADRMLAAIGKLR